MVRAVGIEPTRLYRPRLLRPVCLPFHHARMTTLVQASQYLLQGIRRKVREAFGRRGVVVAKLELRQFEAQSVRDDPESAACRRMRDAIIGSSLPLLPL